MTIRYDIHEVPARGDGRSRHALGTSPTGNAVRTGQCANIAYAQFLPKRRGELESHTPEPKTFRLKKTVRTNDGEYATIECARELSVIPTHKPIRSGKFNKSKLAGGALLDDFFHGGKSWRDAHDDDIYEAARAHASAERTEGHDLWTLNLLVCLAVLARAGCPTVPPWDLPL